MEAKFSKFILMMPKTQVTNQESSKFQESKSRSIKIKIQVKIQEKTQDMQELQEKHEDKY